MCGFGDPLCTSYVILRMRIERCSLPIGKTLFFGNNMA